MAAAEPPKPSVNAPAIPVTVPVAPAISAPVSAKLTRAAVALMLPALMVAAFASASEALITSTLVTVKVVGVEADAVTSVAAVETNVSVVPSPPFTVSAVVKFAVKVIVSLPAPAFTLSALPLEPSVKASLPEPPVMVDALVPAITAVTPAPVLVFPDASKVKTVAPKVPTFRLDSPVTTSLDVAAEVKVVRTLAVEPVEFKVSVSTPGTDNVAPVVTLLNLTVALSAEPVTLL